MHLTELNQLPAQAALNLFLDCCASHRWAALMEQSRPFNEWSELTRAAELHWQLVDEVDRLEAFAGHAKIGDINALRAKYAGHTQTEQGQVAQASDEVLQRLRDLNDQYEQRFGFIFIVCASGKSAEQMLHLLQARLPNSRQQEIANASAEQNKITLLRLQRLLSPH